MHPLFGWMIMAYSFSFVRNFVLCHSDDNRSEHPCPSEALAHHVIPCLTRNPDERTLFQSRRSLIVIPNLIWDPYERTLKQTTWRRTTVLNQVQDESSSGRLPSASLGRGVFLLILPKFGIRETPLRRDIIYYVRTPRRGVFSRFLHIITFFAFSELRFRTCGHNKLCPYEMVFSSFAA